MNLRLGFLASGNGSNVEAILKNIELGKLNADPRVVISNNPQAGVHLVAKNHHLPSYCFNLKRNPENCEEQIVSLLNSYQVNFVVLAGYLKLVSNPLLNAFPNLITNIHPALLTKLDSTGHPLYGGKGMYGLHVHEAVIKSSDQKSGATVHLVNSEYDRGKILGEIIVPRLTEDTPETLAARVLQAEHILYSAVLKEISENKINLAK